MLVPAVLTVSEGGGMATFASTKTTQPIFVWYFGYVGNVFYPQMQLGITPAQMVSEAANMSEAVGSNTSLVFVSAVDQTTAGQVNWANLSQVQVILHYVDGLRKYGQVYGRLDLQQFNSTGFKGTVSKMSIYKEVKYYYLQLNVTGIWLDHASVLYYDNKTAFNQMMQNLSASFPSLHFIVNQTAGQKYASHVIEPTSGTTWANMTYVSPSILPGSTKNIPAQTQFVSWNKYYPGRVIVHFDSFAQTSNEPMGLFANLSNTSEISTINTLAAEGLTAASKNAGFSLLYPVMGGWTYKGSTYNGTLYNSLSIGKFDRNTDASFIPTMVKYP
jgi:hypothetical protein